MLSARLILDIANTHTLHSVLTYVDDRIITGPAMKEINKFVESMKNGHENFVLTNEGDIDKILQIEIHFT